MFPFRKRPRTGMSPTEAVAAANDNSLTLIDVREQAEVAMTGKAKGAIHVPLSRLRDMADPRHPDFDDAFRQTGPIALYCASGGRSQTALGLLQQLGYGDLHNIGGLSHWVQAGGAIEPA